MATLWNSAYSWGEAAGIGTVGVLATPAAVSGGWALGVNVAARGFGWYYAVTGGSGVVLGEYEAEGGQMNYLQYAKAIGANALDAGQGAYNFFLSQGEWWTVNRSFLNASIIRGQQFFLSTAPMGTGGFLREMQYLQGRGIDPFALPWVWVP